MFSKCQYICNGLREVFPSKMTFKVCTVRYTYHGAAATQEVERVVHSLEGQWFDSRIPWLQYHWATY